MQKNSSSEVGLDSPVMKQTEEKRVRETPPVPDPDGKVISNNKVNFIGILLVHVTCW